VRKLSIFVWVVVLSAISFAAFRFYLVMPFRSQTSADLRLSYQLGHWAPIVMIMLMLVGCGLSFKIWRGGTRIMGKIGLITASAVLMLLAYAARSHPAEMMFSRLSTVARIPIERAGEMVRDGLVLGVSSGTESAAYPVPIMAYHHIANDRLAGEPFVVTY